MGEIAARLADLSVVTSDNPRSEDPGRDHRANPRRDRACAATERASRTPTAARRSRCALAGRGAGDTVVIAGKGHEQGQEFEDGRKIPFDDRNVARELRCEAAGAAPR